MENIIELASSRILDDSGYNGFRAVNGLAQTIKNFSIVIKDNLTADFRCSPRYGHTGISILDLLATGSGENGDIKEHQTTSSYKTESRNVYDGKALFRIMKYFANLLGIATYETSLEILQCTLRLKVIDYEDLYEAMRKWKFERNNSITAYMNNPNYRVCIVTQVLQANSEVTIKYAFNRKLSLSVESGSDGSSVDANTGKTVNTEVKLPANTVLGYVCTTLSIMGNGEQIRPTIEIRWTPPIQKSAAQPGGVTPEENSTDVILSELKVASEEEKKNLKKAVLIIMKSSSDIKVLLHLCAEKSAGKTFFTEQLQNRDAVWSLLQLIGFTETNSDIEIENTGRFCALIPVLIQAMSLFDDEDLNSLGDCDDEHKKEIIRIIKEFSNVDDNEEEASTTVILGTQFIEELRTKPYQSVIVNVLAALDFNIDFEKGTVSSSSLQSHLREAVMIILKYI